MPRLKFAVGWRGASAQQLLVGLDRVVVLLQLELDVALGGEDFGGLLAVLDGRVQLAQGFLALAFQMQRRPSAPAPAKPPCRSPRSAVSVPFFRPLMVYQLPFVGWNVVGRQVRAQPPQHVVLMRHLHPAHAAFFAARAKESDAAVPQPRLGPAIDHLALHRQREIVAVHVQRTRYSMSCRASMGAIVSTRVCALPLITA